MAISILTKYLKCFLVEWEEWEDLEEWALEAKAEIKTMLMEIPNSSHLVAMGLEDFKGLVDLADKAMLTILIDFNLLYLY